eukprot:5757817-Pleurochrysis_carterae.AAC.2
MPFHRISSGLCCMDVRASPRRAASLGPQWRLHKREDFTDVMQPPCRAAATASIRPGCVFP